MGMIRNQLVRLIGAALVLSCIVLPSFGQKLASAKEYVDRGYEKERKQDFAGALEDYSKAIEIDSKFADAYYNRGSLYKNKGDLDSALADLNKAIEIDPKHSGAYFNRSNLWKLRGDFDKAFKDIDLSLQYERDTVMRARIYSCRRSLVRRSQILSNF